MNYIYCLLKNDDQIRSYESQIHLELTGSKKQKYRHKSHENISKHDFIWRENFYISLNFFFLYKIIISMKHNKCFSCL